MIREAALSLAQSLDRGSVSRFGLTLCGRVTLTVDGAVPAIPVGAKALALLAYLVLEPRPHGRDALTALLWGDFPEPQAKASLRQALTRLHQVLGDALDISRSSVALVAPIECDVAPFVGGPSIRSGQQSAGQIALGVDVQRFLEGLPIRQCAAFDEWAAATRRTLIRGYAAALAGLASDALLRLDWRAAADAADRWRSADPPSDAAARAAMEARLLGGDYDGALAIFAEHAAGLGDGGRRPDRALQALAEQVRARSHGSDARTASPAESGPPLRARLRCREREWTALQSAWRATANGAARVVLIEGELGVGKTRLASDFATWVTSQGGCVLHGRATEAGAAVPFGLISETLRSGLDAPGVAGTDGQWLAEIARFVPELRQRLPGVPVASAPAPAEAWRLFESVAQMLGAIATEQPAAIVLDDLRWSDGDTAALLQFLVARLAETPILWCVTLTPGTDDRGSRTGRLAHALRATLNAEVLRPARLGEAEVASMLEELLRVPETAGLRGLARRVHEQSAGNPGYVTALAQALVARGGIVQTSDGQWALSPATDSDGFEQSLVAAELATVRAPILERIERLRDDARAILVTIAIANGGRCDPDVLSNVHGVSRLRAAALAEALLERALIAEIDDSYRCAHPVIAQVVRDGVSASWRRAAQQALAEVLSVPAQPDESRHAGPRSAMRAPRRNSGLEPRP
jgi:DNA-binding SARP family transcriptional activator